MTLRPPLRLAADPLPIAPGLVLRSVREGDEWKLTSYFAALSKDTKNRFRPHELSERGAKAAVRASLRVTQGTVLEYFDFPHGPGILNVAVAGEWTQWKPLSLTLDSDRGLWQASFDLPANTLLQYKFLVNGEWALLPGLPTAPDPTHTYLNHERHTAPLTQAFVIEKGAVVIGYFVFALSLDPPALSRLCAYGMGVTERDPLCAVAPSIADEYQNKGLASRALPELIDAAQRAGYSHMALLGGTQASNNRARRFYAKLQFREMGSFRDDHEVHCDMVLELSSHT